MQHGWSQQKPWPVGKCLELLDEKFPALTLGETISHDEIAGTIEERRQGRRYRTVAAAWKNRLLLDRNLVLVAVNGRGYCVASDDQRADVGLDHLRRCGRSAVRAATVAGGADAAKMRPEQRRKADHAARVAGQISGALYTARKALGVDLSGIGGGVKRLTE